MAGMSPVRMLWTLASWRRSQYWSLEKIEAYQLQRVRRLATYAYQRVPFWQCRLRQARLIPDQITDWETFRRIPPLTKQELQSTPIRELLADGFEPDSCPHYLTSGSAGRPLIVYFSRPELDMISLSWARAYLENGQRLFDRTAVERTGTATLRMRAPPTRWFQRLGIMARRAISMRDPLDEQLRQLAAWRPHVLAGTPSNLGIWARALLQRGGDLRIRPRHIFCTSEMLPDQARDVMRRAFGVEPIDLYGSFESALIAWQCPQRQGMHINAETVVVEIEHQGRPVQPGELGQVLITRLYGQAMPLIRYQLGDISTFLEGGCGCGRTLPRIQVIQGRADDFLVGHDGRVFSPWVIIGFLRVVEGVVRFRLVQEARDWIRVMVVYQGPNSAAMQSEVIQGIKARLGPEVRVDVETVSDIPPLPSGKLACVLSRVRVEW